MGTLQQCITAECVHDYDEFMRQQETVVLGQAITLHRLRLSLWWWTHLLHPSQEETASLTLCCLNPIKHTQPIIKATLRCAGGHQIIEWNSGQDTQCDLQQKISLLLDTGTVMGFWCDKWSVLHFLFELLAWNTKVSCCFLSITRSQVVVTLLLTETRGTAKKRALGVQIRSAANPNHWLLLFALIYCMIHMFCKYVISMELRWGF